MGRHMREWWRAAPAGRRPDREQRYECLETKIGGRPGSVIDISA